MIDAEIRQAIGDLIAADYTTAKIYPFNALSHQIDEWPGLFRQSNGSAFGFVIMRTGASAVWRGSGGRDRREFTYSIWAFYSFRPGKIGDNSDDEFAEILDTVYERLKSEPRLGVSGVEEHSLLQWRRITTLNCGEETLHFGDGTLTVRICC